MNSDERFEKWWVMNGHRWMSKVDARAVWDEQQKRVDILEAALRRCAIELEYVQCVENCHSGLCATSEGKACIDIAEKLLGPMQEWPEIKEAKP